MPAVVVVVHLRFKDVEVNTVLFPLYDLEILERDSLVVDIVDGKEGTGYLSKILSNLFHGMDQAQAWTDKEPSIAIPVLTAIFSLGIAGNHMCPDGGGEEPQGSGYILFPVRDDAVLQAVVDHRGRYGYQFIWCKRALAVGFSQLEGHHTPHADAQHVERLILSPEVFVVIAEVGEPLGEGGMGKLLGIGSKARQQRRIYIQSRFMKPLSAVVVDRRGGREAVDEQDSLLVFWLHSYDALCFLTAYLGFIDSEGRDIPVAIPDQGCIPEYECNDEDEDDIPHGLNYIPETQ